MATSLPSSDSKPWHRQFWPWFLMALPASVVVAGLTTLYIANIHSDDLVADEYYKDGLAINLQLEKQSRANDLGLTAQFQFSRQEGVGRVRVTVNGLSDVKLLNLALSHPLEADKDFAVQLKEIEPGVYTAVLQHPIAARWHWILESIGSKPWRLNGSVRSGDIHNEPAD